MVAIFFVDNSYDFTIDIDLVEGQPGSLISLHLYTQKPAIAFLFNRVANDVHLLEQNLGQQYLLLVYVSHGCLQCLKYYVWLVLAVEMCTRVLLEPCVILSLSIDYLPDSDQSLLDDSFNF